MMLQCWLSEGEEITWCWWHHYNTILGMEVINHLRSSHFISSNHWCHVDLFCEYMHVQYAMYIRLFWLCSCCMHVLVLWTCMPFIVCYCLLSCMSVIGEYMQCGSCNNSTFHVLHRTPLIWHSNKVFSIPIDIDPSNPECKPHTVLQLMMHAMCIVVEGKRLSGKSVWLILLFWIRYSMCL